MHRFLGILGVLIMSSLSLCRAASITVDLDKPAGALSPVMHGIFFEDINFGADGGLYTQRIKNGSFEFTPDPMVGWHKTEENRAGGIISLQSDQPLNENNPHYMRLTVLHGGDGFGMSNDGFHGIGLKKGEKYTFWLYARTVADQKPLDLQITLLDDKNQPIGSAQLSGFNDQWKQYSVELESSATVEKGHLLIAGQHPGALDIDMVSLFPKDTWQNRPDGLRTDLVQLLKDLKPKFMRFPGGCIVEGRFLSTRYQWKHTIGDVSQRKMIVNRWNTEFGHRLAPDYFQSFGLGFFEYFQLCEDIGAKPLPILNCGMACQFNSGELATMDQLKEYIQDAFDLVEFANGSPDSEWGKKRAEMGHPAPFGLDMMGVGNEQWGPQYFDRYEVFAKAMKEKYPNVKLVAAAGPFPEGKDFDYAWSKLKHLPVDFVDEHYYARPEWFFANTHRYDSYDRNGPRIFAGEFAAQSVAVVSPKNRNNWQCALSEAAFMTGLERNGDVVSMSSYAPLFGHVEGWQWTPNLIWFDNLRSYGTPNYYVQKLFSTNSGTAILKTQLEDADGLYVCAARDDKSGDVILKLVNAQPNSRSVGIDLSTAASTPQWTGKAIVMASDDLAEENSLDQPMKLVPVESALQSVAQRFSRDLPANSVTVLRLKPAQ